MVIFLSMEFYNIDRFGFSIGPTRCRIRASALPRVWGLQNPEVSTGNTIFSDFHEIIFDFSV
jgi:hypothetical protein